MFYSQLNWLCVKYTFPCSSWDLRVNVTCSVIHKKCFVTWLVWLKLLKKEDIVHRDHFCLPAAIFFLPFRSTSSSSYCIFIVSFSFSVRLIPSYAFFFFPQGSCWVVNWLSLWPFCLCDGSPEAICFHRS